MAAMALDLPGVDVTAMPRATPRVRRLLLDLSVALPWRLGGWLVAAELARAAAIANPAERLDRYRALRTRFVGADARHIDRMNIAIGTLSVERPVANGPAMSWIDGPGFRRDMLLLYVPGGSFVVPRSPHFTAMIARIAREAGAKAMICDYRLAPEFPAPAAIDDVETAAEMLMARGHAAENIVLVAESTGCGIALAAAQRLVARGKQPAGLAFLSPWIDPDPTRPDIHPVARQCARLYLAGANACDPTINPMLGAMRGLPPIAIHANVRDPMVADADLLARRAAAAGVPVELRAWPGRMHVLERHDDPDARRSVAELAAFIDRCQPYRTVA